MKQTVWALLLIGCSVVLQGFAEKGDPTLMLYLPFNEGHGRWSVDPSNPLDAELSNVRWANGAFGSALHFGGTNAFVELSPLPGFNGATQFTLSVWATWQDPESRRYPNLLTSHNWSPGGLMLFVADQACSVRMGRPGHQANVPGQEWRETGVSLLSKCPLETWTHLCVTFDLPHVITYVNGKQVAQTQWPYPLEVESLRLGGWNGTVCHNGLLDELRIYSRTLSVDEVAQLADTTDRQSVSCTYTDPETEPYPIAVALTNRLMILTLDTQGQVVSLVNRQNNRDLLAKRDAQVSLRLKSGALLKANKLVYDKNRLIFHFTRHSGTAIVQVDTYPDFFTFTAHSLTVSNVEEFNFLNLQITPSTYRGTMANMLSDDLDAVCLRGYDLPVEMSVGSDTLRVWTTAKLGLVGWRAGLAAGTKKELPSALRAMAQQAGVPFSRLGGPWSLGAEANRGSYLFADLASAATDDWIALARRGGFSTIHLHGWWQTLGHYDVKTNYFPRGLPEMKETVARIHDAGLRAGIHTLTACIDTRDAWVTPSAHAMLQPFKSYTLARALSPTDTVIYVNEVLDARHDVVFTYSGNGNALRIGDEIIQYSQLQRDAPYAFQHCQRGGFRTTPAAHAAGAQVDYLQQRYSAFYPQPESLLADELAKRIARVYNTCNLDQLYFDGSEGMMSRYGIDVMRHKIFCLLKGDPLIEASCHGAHNWWFHARLGAWDHPWWAAKQFQDAHIALAATYRQSDLVEPQMGWWAPRRASPQVRGLFMDEMVYFACKNLGLDAAMAIQGININNEPLPFYIEQQITVLGWFEHLRLARYFDAPTLERIAVPGQEFELGQKMDGLWCLTPVTRYTHRMSALGNGSEQWCVSHLGSAQPISVRLEALYTSASYDDPKGQVLVGMEHLAKFAASTASADIKMKISEESEETRGAPRNLRLTVMRTGTRSQGAWARAELTFEAPYQNCGGSGAFGLWVKGDGSGALLNMQLQSPREYMGALSDHYVTLDFTGWRYVTLLARERDVVQTAQRVWPYSGHYALYRNGLDLTHLSKVSFYLNDLPVGKQVDVTVSPVMALPLLKTTLSHPVLTVNGSSLTLPFTLISGDFVELDSEGECLHYRENGEPAAYQHLDQVPLLRAGQNTMTFNCQQTAGLTARAEVTINTLGPSFGGYRPQDQIDWKQVTREYEKIQWIGTSQGQIRKTWAIAVRPGKHACLALELCGGMQMPTIQINEQSVCFPVTLQKGQRLFCEDGRTWRVIDKKRSLIAQGQLEKHIPQLRGGALRIDFTCKDPEDARVKLVKIYE